MPRRKLAVMSVVIVSSVQFVKIGSSVFSSRRASRNRIDFMFVGASFHLDALEPTLFFGDHSSSVRGPRGMTRHQNSPCQRHLSVDVDAWCVVAQLSITVARLRFPGG